MHYLNAFKFKFGHGISTIFLLVIPLTVLILTECVMLLLPGASLCIVVE